MPMLHENSTIYCTILNVQSVRSNTITKRIGIKTYKPVENQFLALINLSQPSI